jgi:predicted O-linked N-acetylglucosamine transferase (SPINDLY family)
VFAHKPAPIQATYLGYPNTTGLAQIDWRISDALIDPEKGARRKQPYAEPGVARVGCTWCFVEPADAPEVGPVPRVKNGYATFGCFAKLAKINGKVLDLWGEILAKLPDARMVIKSDGLEDEAARARLAGEFEARGVAADRIELLSRSASRREHLAAVAKIDVAMDTLPWNGKGRTFESMYMGAPVVTMCGELEAGRAGASLLRALRLHDLIGKDAAGFVSKAVALAENETRLKTLRKTLRQRVQKSRLVDGKKLAREMEKIYRAMWRAYCEPESAASAGAGADEGEDAGDEEQARGGAA